MLILLDISGVTGLKKKLKVHQFWKCFVCIAEPSRELRSMLRHLIEMLPASSVSGAGRDSAINLLVKQVPRKSLKNPDNSLTLWVIDQGEFDRVWPQDLLAFEI